MSDTAVIQEILDINGYSGQPLNKIATFNDFGRVVIFNPNVSITTIPPSIQNLTELTYFTLRSSNIELIPSEISYCTKILGVNLYYNKLLTTIPPGIFTDSLIELHINDCPKLEEIPKGIGQSKQLLKVTIARTGIKTLPEEIVSCTKVNSYEFKLNNNLVSLPGGLFNTELLQILIQDCPKINKLPSEIGNAKQLNYISLRKTSIEQFPEEIKECPNLSHIYLFENRRLKAIPSQIFTPSLKELTVYTSLEIETIPEEIGNCINLEKLMIGGTNIKSIPGLISSCINLHTLTLSNSQISKLPDEIKQCQSIKSIQLDGNDFEEIPFILKEISGLHKINMTHNKITQIPHFLSSLTSLTSLYLANNHITTIAPSIIESRILRSTLMGPDGNWYHYFSIDSNRIDTNTLSKEMLKWIDRRADKRWRRTQFPSTPIIIPSNTNTPSFVFQNNTISLGNTLKGTILFEIINAKGQQAYSYTSQYNEQPFVLLKQKISAGNYVLRASSKKRSIVKKIIICK